MWRKAEVASYSQKCIAEDHPHKKQSVPCLDSIVYEPLPFSEIVELWRFQLWDTPIPPVGFISVGNPMQRNASPLKCDAVTELVFSAIS